MSKNTGIALAVIVTIALVFGLITVVKPKSQPATAPTEVVAQSVATTEPAASDAPATEETAPATAAETTPITGEESVTPTTEATAPAATEPAVAETVLAEKLDLANLNIDNLMLERSLGDMNAPVTIIEYASFTCHHCAKFHKEVFSDLKKNYIDTGKARFVFREFPLDNIALKAGQMARCAPKDRFFSLVETLFVNQERWVTSPDPLSALAQFGKLAGVDSETFKACTENKDLENALLQNMQGAQKMWEIKSTPTFVFNEGKATVSGALDYQKYATTIDNLLATQGK